MKNVYKLRRLARGHHKATPQQAARLTAASKKVMEQLKIKK